MKKLLKSRRAMIFNIAVVIVTVIVLTYGFIQLKNKQDVDKVIGENSAIMMIKVQEGEKALIFLDMAARLAMSQALYDMQTKGGLEGSSACGTYYGFHMWNSDSGATCDVNVQQLEKTLKSSFEQNLKARMAAYPRADFLMNTPAAADFVKQPSTVSTTGVAGGAGGGYCVGGQENTFYLTYKHDSGWFPENGVRVFIPKEAGCSGSFPLIIFLHGCQANPTKNPHFGDNENDILPLVKDLYEKKRIAPAIFASPSQTQGDGFRNNPKGVCVGKTGALWGYKMDFKKLVDQIKAELEKKGIKISSVSFTGHSGAGCSSSTGLHRALAQFPNAYAIGQFDTCVSAGLGTSYRSKRGPNTKILIQYGSMGRSAWQINNEVLGLNQKKPCPTETSVQLGGEINCLSDAAGKTVSYEMKNSDHGRAVTVGMERFLLDFFPASAGSPGTGPGLGSSVGIGSIACADNLKVGGLGDSITANGRYVRQLKIPCGGKGFFKNHGFGGWQTHQIKYKMDKEIIRNGYNVVIIHAGINDIASSRSAAHIKSNLQQMYTKASQAGLKVIATTIMPYGGYNPKSLPAARWTEVKQQRIQEVNRWVLSNPPGVTVAVDLYSVMVDPNDPTKTKLNPLYDSGDHLHPNSKGHDRMANEIFVKAFKKEPAAPAPGTQVASTGTPSSGSAAG